MKTTASFPVVSLVILATYLFLGSAWSNTNELSSSPSFLIQRTVTVLPNATEPVLSRAASEVVRLTQAGVDEGVILAFIGNLDLFQLTANQIVYLNDFGISNQLIQTMLAHDRESIARSGQSTNATSISLLSIGDSNKSPVEKSLENKPTTALETATKSAEVSSIAAAQLRIPDIRITALSEPEIQKQEPRISEKLNRPQTVPAKRKILYPVREPYPVELTAPIVFLDPPTF